MNSDFDWCEICFDLRRSGLDNKAISRQLDGQITESMVRQYQRGMSVPCHWRGELLLRLWEQRLDKHRDQAPRYVVLQGVRISPRTNRPKRSVQEAALHKLAKHYGVSASVVAGVLERRFRPAVHSAQWAGALWLPGFDMNEGGEGAKENGTA